MEKQQQFSGKIKRILESAVMIIGVTIFGYLTWHSFRSTYLFVPDYSEMFDVIQDNSLLHITVFMFCIILIYGVGIIAEKWRGWKEVSTESWDTVKRKVEKMVLILTAFWGGYCRVLVGIYCTSPTLCGSTDGCRKCIFFNGRQI